MPRWFITLLLVLGLWVTSGVGRDALRGRRFTRFVLVVLRASFLRSEEPAQRFEAEQQPAGHFVGAQRADYVLVHRQHVAQTAIKWPLLIDRTTTGGLVDKLHYRDASADDM